MDADGGAGKSIKTGFAAQECDKHRPEPRLSGLTNDRRGSINRGWEGSALWLKPPEMRTRAAEGINLEEVDFFVLLT